MSRLKKLIERLLKKPKDFSFSDLEKMLLFFGYDEIKTGKTSGSRVAYYNSETKHIIRLHKPHPKPILKIYQINYLIEELKKEGFLNEEYNNI
jgi:hypothetical protein